MVRYERHQSGVSSRRVFPSAAGFRKDLYRHPREDLEEWDAQALEWAVLQKIDDAGSRALEAMLSNRDALKDDTVRRDWSVFLRTMLLRTPYQMDGTLASLEAIWRNADNGVSKKYAKMRTAHMPETATEYLETLNPDIAKETAFKIFAEAMGIDRTTQHMMALPWRIFDCSSADYGLLLSDHPVVLVPLARDDGHIAMALSPTKYLVAAANDKTRTIAESIRPKLAVRILNKLTAQRAQHCVIATDNSQRSFIEKHFGAAPIPPFLAPTKLGSVDRDGVQTSK